MKRPPDAPLPGPPSMDPNGQILDQNIQLLLRHAYVPALPDPGFRRRLLQTLEIEARRQRRERSGAPVQATPVLTFRRRVAAAIAVAAAILLVALGAFLGGPSGTAPGREELLARGDVALRVGEASWRAATPEELALGLALEAQPVWIQTPAEKAFALALDPGEVRLEPLSSLRAQSSDADHEELLLVAGGAAHEGPEGRTTLEVGVELLLRNGVPVVTAVALADPDQAEKRQLIDAPILPGDTEEAGPAQATLFGDIKDTDGVPVESFRVALLRERVGNEYANPLLQDFEGGSFVWEDILPGRYRIYVHAEGYALLDLGFKNLAVEEIVEGTLVTGGTIRGHVIDDATGNPVGDALVLSEEDSPQDGLLLFPDADTFQWLPAATRTLADGSFELAHTSLGKHTVRVSAEGYGATWSDDVTIDTDALVDGITIRLPSGGAIEGRVVGPDGAPKIDEQIIVAIMNDDQRPHMNFSMAQTDATGLYRVENLPIQRMLVIYTGGSIDNIPVVKGVDIVGGETVVVDFPGTASGTRVFGRVTKPDGTPYARHNIAIMDKTASPLEMQSNFNASTTMGDGHFEFEHVQPGTYLFYIVSSMGRWIRLVDEFEVPAWSEYERNVTVVDLAISGQVTDGRNGEPAPECSLIAELLQDGESVFAGNVTADADGRYRLGLLNPGRYRVTAYPTQGGLGFERSGEIVVDESGSAQKDFQLFEGAPVEVHVRDGNGQPVSGAYVMFVDAQGQGHTLSQLPVTDERGIYRASGIRVGELKALVEHSEHVNAVEPFTCRANQENRVEVVLSPMDPTRAGEEQ